MNNPFSGFLAFMTGTTVTVTEVIREGSLWMTFFGAALALVGGVWTYRTARVKFQIEMARLKLAELEFERANGLQNGDPVKKKHHHR